MAERLTTDELAAINGRLRTAYQLVEEVKDLIKHRVRWPVMKVRRNLNSLGENFNNRIDWLKEDGQ